MVVAACAIDLPGAAIVDFDEQLDLGQATDNSRNAIAERRMKDERFCVAVIEQVPEFFVEVAVVHVDRDAAHLERGVLGFEVFVAVVEKQADLAVGHETSVDICSSDARRAVVVFGPCAAGVAVHNRRSVTDYIGEGLPHCRKMHFHACSVGRLRNLRCYCSNAG